MKIIQNHDTEKLNLFFKKVCREALLQDKAFIENYCIGSAGTVFDTLQAKLSEGICSLHLCQERGQKGRLAYLQFSFLMSGQYSGEHLLKIDFYDGRFYADPYEIDCFWDYGFLFPFQQQKITQIISAVRMEITALMDYEIYERLPAYRLGQMFLLQELLRKIQAEEKIMSLLRAEADPGIQVIYGAYMSEAQRLFTVNKE